MKPEQIIGYSEHGSVTRTEFSLDSVRESMPPLFQTLLEWWEPGITDLPDLGMFNASGLDTSQLLMVRTNGRPVEWSFKHAGATFLKPGKYADTKPSDHLPDDYTRAVLSGWANAHLWGEPLFDVIEHHEGCVRCIYKRIMLPVGDSLAVGIDRVLLQKAGDEMLLTALGEMHGFESTSPLLPEVISQRCGSLVAPGLAYASAAPLNKGNEIVRVPLLDRESLAQLNQVGVQPTAAQLFIKPAASVENNSTGGDVSASYGDVQGIKVLCAPQAVISHAVFEGWTLRQQSSDETANHLGSFGVDPVKGSPKNLPVKVMPSGIKLRVDGDLLPAIYKPLGQWNPVLNVVTGGDQEAPASKIRSHLPSVGKWAAVIGIEAVFWLM